MRRDRRASLSAIVVVTAALLAGCLGAQPTMSTTANPRPSHAGCAATGTADALCIVIVGDSIGVGAPLTGDDRWWVRLRRALELNLPGRSITIDSWAETGSQVDLLEWSARNQPAVATYDIAIVIEGVNDALIATPLDAWKSRYEGAIAAIEAQGPTVVVTTPPPVFENGAFGSNFDATAAAIRAVAKAGNRPLFDLATAWRLTGAPRAASYYADAIHQGPAGQELMASMALDIVLDIVGAR